MGWFKDLTGSIGGGVSNLLGGVLAPVFGGANQLVHTATNSAGAMSIGGSQGMNFLQGIFGGLGFGGSPMAQPPVQAMSNNNNSTTSVPTDKKTIGMIIGGVLLVLGIIIAMVKSKKK